MSIKILCIGCFHGDRPKGFKKWVEENEIDMVFALGDMPSWRPRKYWKEMAKKIDDGELDEDTELEEYIGEKKFKAMRKRDLDDAERVLRSLNYLGVPVYLIHGNHDPTDVYPWYKKKKSMPGTLEELLEPLENISFLDFENVPVGQWNFIFYGAKYPNLNRERYSKSKHNKKLKLRKRMRSEIIGRIDDPDKTIIITHQPPYETKLDLVGEADNPGAGNHYGDDVLRRIIERKQPALVVCSHFHENQGYDYIGDTKIACTGYGAQGQGLLIELTKKVKTTLVNIE